MNTRIEANFWDADELVALARHDLQQGRLADALAKLKIVLNGANPPTIAMAMAARIYAELRLFDRARPLFEKFLTENAGATDETFQLGMVYFDTGDLDQALELWDRVLKDQPTHPPALFFSAMAHARKGRGADARRALDIIIMSAPPDNLYFEKAREFLPSLEAGTIIEPARGNPYRAGH
jgi:tetratricopeptide (TPR) repeat protein